MFVGREQQIEQLHKLWNSGTFELVGITGAKRTGKTALINNFLADKSSVYFCAAESGLRNNMDNLRDCVLRFSQTGTSLQTFSDCLRAAAGEQRTALVLDDFQYFASGIKGIVSELKSATAGGLASSRLMLIICGTPGILGGELDGMFTASLKAEPFNYFETRKYYPSLTPSSAVEMYALTGGVPKYLAYADDKLSIEENIRRMYLSAEAPMLEEPLNLMNREVREPSQYNAVLHALAGGNARMADICAECGIVSSACAEYLKNLVALGIVRKERPFGEEGAKKTEYTIVNPALRFWYWFIPDVTHYIQSGKTDTAMNHVSKRLNSFIRGVFAEVCAQWLVRENTNKRLPIEFTNMGRWFDGKASIDIAACSDGDNAIFGDCKWASGSVGAEVLQSLVERSESLSYRNKYLYLFSKSGFTTECEARAARLRNVRMVAF